MCCCQKYMRPFIGTYEGLYKSQSIFGCFFTTCSCCVSTDYVSRYRGYYKFGCVNISFISYFINVLPFERTISTLTFGLCRDVLFSESQVHGLFECTNLQNIKVKASVKCFFILVMIVFVVFCCIVLYHVWDTLSKSFLKQPFAKIMRIFNKISTNYI